MEGSELVEGSELARSAGWERMGRGKKGELEQSAVALRGWTIVVITNSPTTPYEGWASKSSAVNAARKEILILYSFSADLCSIYWPGLSSFQPCSRLYMHSGVSATAIRMTAESDRGRHRGNQPEDICCASPDDPDPRVFGQGGFLGSSNYFPPGVAVSKPHYGASFEVIKAVLLCLPCVLC